MKDESHIVGCEDFANNLVSQLIDKGDGCANLRVISVFGDGAIGKTALVRSTCNQANVKNYFDRCAWVWVGPKPNLVHLMVDLLKELRVPELRDVERKDKEKLSEELLRVLIGCCYLIVLDDLCELHLMDKLMMVLADSRNGSRVIVTTCNANIPSSIDPWYSTSLKLSPLNREHSEKLLEKCRLPEYLLPLKETILSKSGGSPTKILLLGGLLSANTNLIRCTELVGKLLDNPEIQDVVRLSVDDLPEGLEPCAMYLTLFPKESEIPTRRFFGFWSAENLVSSALGNGLTGLDAEKCFEILVSRNMVHVARQKWDGSARSCRLSGSLYDVFYQMAKNQSFLKIYGRSIHDEGKFGAMRIAIHRDISGGGEARAQINVLEAGRERSETNADISGGEAKAQINVLEAGRERSETNAQEAHKIPPTEPHQRMSAGDNSKLCGIQQLFSYVSFNTVKLGTPARDIVVLLKPLVLKRDTSLLRVLDLEGVYKPSLPKELGKILRNLTYLGLRWTLLEWLPESVALLSCLETLDLKYTNISYLPDSILGAENLRHLYMNEVDFGYSARQHLYSKKSLNRNIQTIWGLAIDDYSPMSGVLRKLTGLRKLALTWRGLAVAEATDHMMKLTTLKSLRLQLKDPTGEPLDPPDELSDDYEMSDMSRLKSLSNLYLLGYLGVQSLLESHIPPKLKVLTLSMSKLKVDPMGVLGKLICLTTLRLFANSYDGKTMSVSEDGTFPNLRVLKLWKLDYLTEWTIQANAMPCLADLEIKDCKELETFDGLQRIKTLELITLVKVPSELERRVRDMQPNVPIIAKNEESTRGAIR